MLKKKPRHHSLVSLVAAAAIALGAAPWAHYARAADLPPLNSPPTSNRIPGKFIWADLFTSDANAAAKFYTGLFGWTAEPVEHRDKTYFIMSNGGRPVAGLVQRSSGGPRSSVWIAYISVADAKGVMQEAVSGGAQERAPSRDFPSRGMQGIFTDNEGSAVGVLQSASGDPPDLEPGPGDWNWFQLFSQRAHVAANFYGQVFGYEVREDSRPGKGGHYVLSAGGRARAGVAPLAASPDAQAGWLGVVRVADIEEATSRVAGLGGTVLVAPRPAALGSRFAVVSDPTGGTIGLVQFVENANPADRP